MNPEIKKDFFGTTKLGRDFYHYRTLESTQTQVKTMLQENAIRPGTVVLADFQTGGRGTQGRSWFSLPKPQLMFSIPIHVQWPPQKLPIINILSAVLLADLLEKKSLAPTIKWPNDVYIESKKVAGILSELTTHGGHTVVILGIGVNTAAAPGDFPPELENQATALSMHAQNIDRLDILANFLLSLEQNIFEKKIDDVISYVQQRFKELWLYKNQRVSVQQGQETFSGLANEIDDHGALLVHSPDGLRKIIHGKVLPEAV